MHVLLKSILTGFGVKIGAELAKIVSNELHSRLENKGENESEADSDAQEAESDSSEDVELPLPLVPDPAPLPNS